MTKNYTKNVAVLNYNFTNIEPQKKALWETKGWGIATKAVGGLISTKTVAWILCFIMLGIFSSDLKFIGTYNSGQLATMSFEEYNTSGIKGFDMERTLDLIAFASKASEEMSFKKDLNAWNEVANENWGVLEPLRAPYRLMMILLNVGNYALEATLFVATLIATITGIFTYNIT